MPRTRQSKVLGQDYDWTATHLDPAGLRAAGSLPTPEIAIIPATSMKAPRAVTLFAEVVPNRDGAGIVDAVGDGVAGLQVRQRVWIREAAWQRADGTAQEYVVLPAANVAALPGSASFDLGASLGIPVLTAQGSLWSTEVSHQRPR